MIARAPMQLAQRWEIAAFLSCFCSYQQEPTVTQCITPGSLILAGYHEYPMPALNITRSPLDVLTPSLMIVFCAIRALPPIASAV